MSHSHSHSHGGSCADEHAETAEEEAARGLESLYRLIDHNNIRVFNAADEACARKVFRPYEERNARDESLQSEEDDPELIVHVPFTSCVKIKSITICGGSSENSPKNVRVFVNRDDVDFSNASDLEPTQALELIDDVNVQADAEYKLRAAKFQRVQSVTLFFDENFGADETEIYYIGFRGEFDQEITRKAVIATYESKPMLEDHKQPTTNAPREGL
eukprot:TRINITY_DN7749_c0_g1_i1.p1 TRINITY_DN7749_c0_g1~~TRINITY_DN7749_c0_g1_i1.p1  ORF type:complete len:216 (+),score=19.52 TRINITY_DN7749_c0_g1_i1:124-771(+)